jgi:hypothetical protein
MGDSSDEEYDQDDTASVLSDRLDPGNPDVDTDLYLSCHPPPAPDADDPMVDAPPGPRVSSTPPKCWMCTFAPHPTAILMHNFVINNVSTMDLSYIASQIKDEIKTSFPHAAGIRKRDIVRHVSEHMIAPQVKLASTIRSLSAVADTLKGGLTHRDPETNDVLVDIKNTELFLKVVSQIVAAYKLDSAKLLFGGQHVP